jgi:eukaryotic-like serine/threonine-protein kinase
MADNVDTRPAAFLVGLELADGWIPTKLVSPTVGKSGGNFSLGYEAERRNQLAEVTGEIGFVKAIDFSKWTAFGTDPVSALPVMTAAFQFELDVVNACSGRRMRNVVRGVASGRISVGGGILPIVNYIVFEVADGDVRDHLDALVSFDTSWALRVLHNIAKGLGQLHGSEIYHQDLKPSNVLMFDKAPISEGTKLGDLGRASRTGFVAPHDVLAVPGDPVYSPPEKIYGYRQNDETLDRLASDAYHLGSMAYFLFTRIGMTAALLGGLPPAFRPPLSGGTWGGTFDQALPHLRVSFDSAIQALRTAIPAEVGAAIANDLVETVRQLCDPDPLLRGHPNESTDATRRFSMDRYVSKFDLLSRRSEIDLKKALV